MIHRLRDHLYADTRSLVTLVGLVAALAVLSLTLACAAEVRSAHAQQKAAEVARHQADADRVQQQRLRDAICGTFVAVSEAPVSDRTTPVGRTLVIETAKGARAAGCVTQPSIPRLPTPRGN